MRVNTFEPRIFIGQTIDVPRATLLAVDCLLSTTESPFECHTKLFQPGGVHDILYQDVAMRIECLSFDRRKSVIRNSTLPECFFNAV